MTYCQFISSVCCWHSCQHMLFWLHIGPVQRFRSAIHKQWGWVSRRAARSPFFPLVWFQHVPEALVETQKKGFVSGITQSSHTLATLWGLQLFPLVSGGLFIHWLKFIQLWLKIANELILLTAKHGLSRGTRTNPQRWRLPSSLLYLSPWCLETKTSVQSGHLISIAGF